MKKCLCMISFIFSIILSLQINSYAHVKPENISVSDYSGVLSDGVKDYIKSRNDILSNRVEAKIIMVTTESTDGYPIDEYCRNLYNNWKIYNLGRNNNIFFVIDTLKNEYSFVRGNAIKLAVTEQEIYQYIIDSFEPFFSKSNYDKAVMSLYNALGSWYENEYNNLDLNLDNHIQKYLTGVKSKDSDPKESKMWIWITVAIFVVIAIILLKIKRNIELRYRQMQRRRLRKKFQIDVDKLVNS